MALTSPRFPGVDRHQLSNRHAALASWKPADRLQAIVTARIAGSSAWVSAMSACTPRATASGANPAQKNSLNRNLPQISHRQRINA
jgi:hypothetical protein